MGPGYPSGPSAGAAHQPLKLSGSFPLPKPSPSQLPDQPEKQTIRNLTASQHQKWLYFKAFDLPNICWHTG